MPSLFFEILRRFQSRFNAWDATRPVCHPLGLISNDDRTGGTQMVAEKPFGFSIELIGYIDPCIRKVCFGSQEACHEYHPFHPVCDVHCGLHFSFFVVGLNLLSPTLFFLAILKVI
jgi:hypothetical protein